MNGSDVRKLDNLLVILLSWPKKIETAARTWHRRVICQACTRLCLACVPVSIFLARVVVCRAGILVHRLHLPRKPKESLRKDRFSTQKRWNSWYFSGQGLQGCSFSLLWTGTFSPEKEKEKNTTCRDRCAQSLVRQSCSRNNVVLPVGKTSLALDTVFGHDLEKE